jgi:hypothetical protein
MQSVKYIFHSALLCFDFIAVSYELHGVESDSETRRFITCSQEFLAITCKAYMQRTDILWKVYTTVYSFQFRNFY